MAAPFRQLPVNTQPAAAEPGVAVKPALASVSGFGGGASGFGVARSSALPTFSLSAASRLSSASTASTTRPDAPAGVKQTARPYDGKKLCVGAP